MKKEERLFENMSVIDEKILKEVIEMKKHKSTIKKRVLGIAAAIVLSILTILPNTSPTIAYAMSNLPLVGTYFEIVTIRDYNYTKDKTSITAEIPAIDPTTNPNISVENLNKSVDDYTNQMIEKFKADLDGDLGLLDISYEVITDTENWFTLQIGSTEIQASGYSKYQYFHIDKTTDQMIELADLFGENIQYVDIISQYIEAEMIKTMTEDENIMYFIERQDGEGFSKIDKNQNFYFNSEGDLVIVFEEYSVAPGYMGCPEFIIPTSVISYEKQTQ